MPCVTATHGDNIVETVEILVLICILCLLCCNQTSSRCVVSDQGLWYCMEIGVSGFFDVLPLIDVGLVSHDKRGSFSTNAGARASNGALPQL